MAATKQERKEEAVKETEVREKKMMIPHPEYQRKRLLKGIGQ